ncbi:protein-O-mannosyltransferase-like protein [Jatrophihabitans sp. GAS493]|nr:protein-O-mannosyltransferase-like protein [Jatrophihabitans sp. GAS493]
MEDPIRDDTTPIAESAAVSATDPAADPAADAADAESGPVALELPPVEPVAPSLQPWHDPHPWHGIFLATGIGLLAFVIRVWNVGHPRGKVFDEVYYATEGRELIRFGYEDNRGYMFVVHPPLGKWLIGLSTAFAERMGWSAEVGWRLAPAIAGTIAVILLTRVARRMFRSNFFGAVAGLLLALEGLSIVLSRTALLDIFLQPFLIAAFGALLYDRERMRARLASLVEAGVPLRDGIPRLGPRPWRLVAGVMLGLAGGVKWSALSFYVAMLLLSLVWDRYALRAAGVRSSWRWAVRRSWLYAIGSLFLVPLGTYVLVWTGWIAGNNGWNRHWADTHSPSATLRLPLGVRIPFNWGFLPNAIRSLGDYHYHAYTFHEGLYSPHPFSSKPWGWLVLGRPVDFYYDGNGTSCGATHCSSELLLIGTPLLWWAFTPALIWVIWHYVTTRDWRAGVVLVMFAAGWLVWFQDPKRTMFIFYMAPLIPFLVLGLTLALGALLGPAGAELPSLRETGRSFAALRERAYLFAEDRRRFWGSLALTFYLAVVIVDFLWMWPLFRGAPMPTNVWQAHMWLPSWI